MKRFLWWILPAVALIAGALVWHYRNGESKADKYLTATVERGNIEDSVSALGALQPLQYVDVGTQVTGQLKKLLVEAGDKVEKGALVAEIDPTLFKARVDESKANIKLLEAQLAERIAQQRLAAEIHARNKQLIADQATSQEALQQSRAAEEQATAQVEAVRAQILEAESRLAADEANLLYTKIYAPMTGTVVSITAKQGQTLVASQQAPTILRIADLRTMTVWAQVSEADVPKIKEGMPAYFNTLGLPERRWTGAVRQVMPTPESVNNVILYNVLFDTDNPDGALKTQMSAQVFFVNGRAQNALLVPVAALQQLKSGAGGKQERHSSPADGKQKGRVYQVRVLKDGKVEERRVTIGLATRLLAEVIDGLSEGEAVVVGKAEGGKQDGPTLTPRLR